MYKILGNDGNEYGPVSAEQIVQWIAENRVEKKTPVMPEGAPDWVFLQSLPEFGAAFGLSPAGPPPLPAGAKTTKPARLQKETREEDTSRNSRAWLAYCLGIVSVLPPFGALLGIPALILGIAGLRFQRQHPESGGRFHAWMGIILGGVFSLVYLTLIVLVVVTIVVQRRSIR